MALAIIFLLHIVLCVISSKLRILSGVVLLLNGISLIRMGYFMNMPDL